MARLNQLKEERAAKVAEMRALNEKALNDNRDLNDVEQKEWNALNGEYRNINGQLERAEKLAVMERMADAESVSNPMDAELRSYSVSKALRESMNGNLSGLEAEYHTEMSKGREVRGVMVPSNELLETRALKTTTPGAGPGGNLIATNLAPVQDRFRSMLKLEGMGATVLRGLTGNLDLPNVLDSGSAHWISEHTDTTRSDMKFEKTSMGPKTVSGEYEVSRRMLLQSDTALESLLRSDLGYILAQALDSAGIKGGGTNEPTGILAHAGVAKVTTATDLTDTAADLISALELDDVSGTAAFLTNPNVGNIARKIKDADGRNIPLAEIFHSERLEMTTQVPTDIGAGSDKNALIYGHWSSLIVGYWSAVDILVNPYHADVASKGGALIHAFLDADVAVRQPQAFRYAEI
ncbi:MAG: phage major capsid protein [Robiginitomaculum sp.]